MNRRSFLQRAGAGAATLAAASTLPVPTLAGEPSDLALPSGSRIHVLGMPVLDSAQRLVKMMSDDIFDRVLAVVHGRSFYLRDAQHAGEYGITDLWNTSVKVDLRYAVEHPVAFPLEQFRRETSGWTRGPAMCPGCGGTPAAEAFTPDLTQVGLPFLPAGVLWAAHYIDEDTGFAMRAVAQHEIYLDNLSARWDVLCG